MSNDKKINKPMDESITEQREGSMHVNAKRNAYALVQLVAEVRELFPETPYEFSNYNGRNTALSVSFDLTAVPEDEAKELSELLQLVKTDSRVLDVTEEDGQVLVDIFPSPRFQDIANPFYLAESYVILMGGSQ